MSEYGSFSKEIAALLEISPNTLRRWSIDLEKKGYVFERNEKDQRIYYKRDVFALKKLQQLVNERVSMETALSTVAGQYNNKKELEETLSVIKDDAVKVTFSKEDLKTLIQESVQTAVQTAVNQEREEFNELIKQEREAMLKAFEVKVNDVIEIQSRSVTKAIRNQQEETQKLLAAAEEEKNKSFWRKLFKK